VCIIIQEPWRRTRRDVPEDVLLCIDLQCVAKRLFLLCLGCPFRMQIIRAKRIDSGVEVDVNRCRWVALTAEVSSCPSQGDHDAFAGVHDFALPQKSKI
jgi:hypothetical protein